MGRVAPLGRAGPEARVGRGVLADPAALADPVDPAALADPAAQVDPTLRRQAPSHIGGARARRRAGLRVAETSAYGAGGPEEERGDQQPTVEVLGALERWTVEAYAHPLADRRIDPAKEARAAHGLANTAEESASFVHTNERSDRDPGLLSHQRFGGMSRWKASASASFGKLSESRPPGIDD